MKTFFIIAMAAAGVTDWLKNFIPAKVTENKAIMAVIAGVVSIIAGVGYQFANSYINHTDLVWQNVIVFTAIVVGLTQTSYTVLVKTFKAVKAKLTEKATVPIDSDALAEEVSSKLMEGVTNEISKVTKSK